jgi:hypothetical protein
MKLYIDTGANTHTDTGKDMDMTWAKKWMWRNMDTGMKRL